MRAAFSPSREVVFDLETDGLLDTVSVIHCLVIYDYSTGRITAYNNQPGGRPLADGLAILADPATVVIAHNGTRYDCAVLKKLHKLDIPWWRQRDTMVVSRLVWPELALQDIAFRKKKHGAMFPGQFTGIHTLEAWGHRLGEHKGDYRGDPSIPDEKERWARRWDAWNQEMEDYCVQDVVVTKKLWDLIKSKDYSEQAILLETQVAYIVARQEAYGFLFDEAAAVKLYAVLAQRRLELEAEVRKVFKPRYLPDGKTFTPSRDNKTTGYVAGAPLTKIKLTEFNLGSRDHVARWLGLEYGWKPTEFTNDGKPKVDDEVIAKLPYKEAAPLKEYFMVAKRLGQLAEGKEAWLKKAGPDKRLHGRVNTNGAVTGRMTHSSPNMAQVPSGRAPYGHECRALFIVPLGKLLVGADADALELRDLAGFMAAFDGGAYIKTVLEGDKSKGTDMHSVNCRALGMDPKARPFLDQGDDSTGRDIAKTWFYAFIYGAGDEKLGTILTGKKGPDAVAAGKRARDAFLRNLPAMGALVKKVKAAAKARGHLLGLDKRQLAVRSQHAALNTLLQSAGAVQMKKALCILDDHLQSLGYVPGTHYEFVANVHDEWQIEVNEDIAELVGRAAVEAIRLSGEHFGFRCPLAGAYDIGRSWAETH
ncbi:MAG: DNA polymerase [Comamonadaceae bacterium]|nr:DNA polymerase [Comamonadaceae bacterium]